MGLFYYVITRRVCFRMIVFYLRVSCVNTYFGSCACVSLRCGVCMYAIMCMHDNIYINVPLCTCTCVPLYVHMRVPIRVSKRSTGVCGCARLRCCCCLWGTVTDDLLCKKKYAVATNDDDGID